MQQKKKKGFTLIELVVIMSVIGLLVLLAAPHFLGQTKEATKTKHLSNAKVVEDASERYYVDHGEWPRLTDDAYSSEEIEAFADKIYNITGDEVALDPEGNYYDIDYEALATYAKIPEDEVKNNYILRNPVFPAIWMSCTMSRLVTDRTTPLAVLENSPYIVMYWSGCTR